MTTHRPRAKEPVRVRCLGPLPNEHTFLSRDPTRERICYECRRLIESRRYSRTYDDVIKEQMS